MMSDEEDKNIVAEDDNAKSADDSSEAAEKPEVKNKSTIAESLRKRQAFNTFPNIPNPLDNLAVKSAAKTNNMLNKASMGIGNSFATMDKFLNIPSVTRAAMGLNMNSPISSTPLDNIKQGLFPDNLLDSIKENYFDNQARIISVVPETPKLVSVEPTFEKLSMHDEVGKFSNLMREEAVRKKKMEQTKVDALKELCLKSDEIIKKDDELIKQTAENQNLTTSLIVATQETNKNTQDMVIETRKSSEGNKKSIKFNIWATIGTIVVTIAIAYIQYFNDDRISKLQNEVESMRLEKISGISKGIEEFEQHLSNQQNDNLNANLMILEELRKLNALLSVQQATAEKDKK